MNSAADGVPLDVARRLGASGAPARILHPGCRIALWTVDIAYVAWSGQEEPSLRENCRKRTSLVAGVPGRSCPEIEVTARLRGAGWDAIWLASFRCGPPAWQEYRGDALGLPVWVVEVLRGVRRRRGIPESRSGIEPLGGVPDVVAWIDAYRRLVFVECKRPGEPLTLQSAWLEAALTGPEATRILEDAQVLVAVSLIASGVPRDGIAPGTGPSTAGSTVATAPRHSPARQQAKRTEGSTVALKVSETYRGHTIFYDPTARRWLVALTPDGPLTPHPSAFQARRAINIALDGQSESWPKRER